MSEAEVEGEISSLTLREMPKVRSQESSMDLTSLERRIGMSPDPKGLT